MFKKDHILIGLALGFIVPGILMLLTTYLLKASGKFLSPDYYENCSLFMIALNGILMRYFTVKREQDNIGRGLIIATFILAIIWVVMYQM